MYVKAIKYCEIKNFTCFTMNIYYRLQFYNYISTYNLSFCEIFCEE